MLICNHWVAIQPPEPRVNKMTALELRLKINKMLLKMISSKGNAKQKLKEKIVMLEVAYKEIEGWGHTYHWQKA